MRERRNEGLQAEWLDGKEAQELCPWLSDKVEAACATRIEPTLDSAKLTLAAFKAAQAQGARLVVKQATGITINAARALTVQLEDGSTIQTDNVVLAMGPWTRQAERWLGLRIPVKPQKGELLYTHLPHEHAHSSNQDKPPAAMHNMDDGGVILPRRLSRTVLGATKEEKGYDRSPSRYAWDFILPRVRRLTRRITEEAITHHTACLRPMPADGKPYVGKLPGYENIFIAAGHWSEGIHYAPLTGKSIAEIITTGNTSTDISVLSPLRITSD